MTTIRHAITRDINNVPYMTTVTESMSTEDIIETASNFYEAEMVIVEKISILCI